MLDHLTLTARDFQRSLDFYTRALAPLGYGVSMRFEQFVGLGTKRKPSFWLKPGPVPTTPLHLAFVATSRAGVDGFHAAALAAGGQDNGPPGLRPHYHRNYYGAFVMDPDGHNIEAVCHEAPAAPQRAKKAAGKKKKRR